MTSAEQDLSVFWLGGGCGAGKTSVATAVARRLDLRLYPVDMYGFDHIERMSGGRYPESQRWNASDLDARWLRPGRQLADDFVAVSRERMSLILEDLVAFGSGPTILVEGPQLFPKLVSPLVSSPAQALWLLPSGSFGRLGVQRRREVIAVSNEEQAITNRADRDILLTQMNRAQARDAGLRSMDVDGSQSLKDVIAVVMGQVRKLPDGLRPADDASARRELRETYNAALARQLRGWWSEVGRVVMPDAPERPFQCECGVPGCQQDVTLNVGGYEERRKLAAVVAHP